MDNELKYKNNPLNGLSLKKMLTEIVDHYGFEILFAYLNINCFKTNPSIDSSVKFLKKTEWAREKVEVFYLYQFKNLPRASSQQFALPPRDRVIPDGQTAGEPAELSLEDAQKLREKQAKKATAWKQDAGFRSRKSPGAQRDKRPSARARTEQRDSTAAPSSTAHSDNSPWAKWNNK